MKTFVVIGRGVDPPDAACVVPTWSSASQLAASFALNGNGEPTLKSFGA